jgi:hypothetical protein
MDYVTRQFINLTKKLRKELRKTLSALSNSLQKQTEAIKEAAKRYRQQPQEPQSVSAEIRLPPEVERQRQTQHNRSHRVQVVIAFATCGTFIAAAFYGAVAMLQWWDFNESIGISQTIARQSRIQAAAAIVSVQQGKRSFELDERAWVGIEISQFRYVKNSDGTIKFVANGTIKNSGKTPALKVSTYRTITFTKPSDQTVDYDKEWDRVFAEIKRLEKADREAIRKYRLSNPEFTAGFAALAASQTQKWHGIGGAIAPGSTYGPTSIVDATLSDPNPNISLPTKTIYWLGRITYQDIFSDQMHTTKICIWYAAGAFELCPNGNSMD